MNSLDIVFSTKNQVEVLSRPVAEPGPGEILVENCVTLISTGTEMICLQANFAPGTHWAQWMTFPFVPGYSSAGIVRAVGNGVTGFEVGDRVASRANHQQFAVTSAARSVLIPDDLSDEQAAWLGLGEIVQVGVRRAQHALGDVVAVVGLGLLGQLVVQYARLSGAQRIIAIDPAQARLDLARLSGADHLLAATADNASEAVAELTAGRMADVVYDVTGHPAVLAQALTLARRFGTLLLLGDAGDPSQQHLTGDVIRRGVRIVGAHDTYPPAQATDCDIWTHNKMVELFFTYLRRGQMDTSHLISHRFAPQDAPDAYRLLRDRRESAMGVLFDWGMLGKR